MATDRADLSVNGWNSDYLESLYRQWASDPQSVDAQWRQFFSGFDLGSLPANWMLLQSAESKEPTACSSQLTDIGAGISLRLTNGRPDSNPASRSLLQAR